MRYKRILCATDFSDPASHALAEAATIARNSEGKLTLVHVYRPLPVGAYELSGPFMPELAEQMRKDAEIGLARCKTDAEELGAKDVGTLAIEGVAWDEITRLAERTHADLIIVGTHGRSGIRRALIGSVTDRVIRHAPCAVLVVR